MQQKLPESVLRHARTDFMEMPGLRLTQAQAQRLWGLDRPSCDELLNNLVETRFLFRTRDGVFIRNDLLAARS